MPRALCLLAILVIAAGAAASAWRLDPATRIAADVAWQGRSVEVRFPDVAGAVEFDPDHPERARATIRVSARTATTGLPPADALLRGRDYLDAARYPEITFSLDRLTRTSSETAEILGGITLRGVTRPVTFSARVFRYGPAADDPLRFEAGFDLSGRIDRTEFGSTGGLPDVAAVLPVRIHLLMRSQ
jgi:polyisoprenoid-binding protein YceI